jgi:CHAT domain-containing protein
LRKGYELPKLVKLGSEKAIAAVPAGKGFSELYKLIWEPMDSLLQDVNTIYYSPDGKLNNISFAALCGKGKETELASNEIKRGSKVKTVSKIENCIFLSDRYTLHQLSTTRYLAEGLKDSKIDNSLLVFGGVIYDEIPSNSDTLSEPDMADYALSENITRSSANQSRMEYLPGTKTELQSLQKILNKKQWKVRAFSDKNASENNFKSEVQKESPGILHIATHGFAFPDVEEKKKGFGEENKTYRDADNPMARCGLLLAGANHSWLGKADTMLAKTGEDGILTALEVSNLPLRNTKLVVLSACETGLGKIEGSEGTFGLKRGFKLAGVEQIIVSLWSVPDKETMELMELFYTDLSKTHSAVISFKKAQKEMRIKYPSEPEKWAGFVLVR